MKRNFPSRINSFVILALMLASSCESIYIPDPIDPRLPKFTESGNNVAGALINDKLWKSEYYLTLFGSLNTPYVFYLVNTDSVSIQFSGEMEDQQFGYSTISFGLQDAGVKSMASMRNLEGIKFELGKGKNSVSIDNGTQCQQMGIGQIYFRSVKYNTNSDDATISGTFSFNVTDPICGNLSVTYGRFDMQISEIYGN